MNKVKFKKTENKTRNQASLISIKKVLSTHQLRFSPLQQVSTYLVIFPSVEQATLCRYREMMLLKMRAQGYKLSWLLIHGTTCLDRNQYPDVRVQKGGGRTIKASMSQLYYVPACVSSLMQSRCPPNVTHTRIYARARGERFFVLHKRNFFLSLFFFLLQTHFSWNGEIRFPRSLFIYFLCASLLSSGFIRSSLSRPQRATQRERAGSLDNQQVIGRDI